MGGNSSTLTVRSINRTLKKTGNVYLSQFDLDSIPQFIKFKINLSLITTFDVSDNKLTAMPIEVINQMDNLTTLNLNSNQITRFITPSLPELKRIDVGFNPISELPGDLDQLPNLEYIGCNNCLLRTLPLECLKRMPCLSLLVQGNYLSIGYDHIPLSVQRNLTGTNAQKVPSEILDDFLYLGSLGSATEWDELVRLGIRHIVCMVDMFELPFVGKVTYKTIRIDDIETADIKQYFTTINHFIDSVKKAEGRVLVHCAAGVSRSSSAVLAYLMYSLKMTYQQAKDYVTNRRPCICPNDGFEKQLIEFEQSLRPTAA